VSKHSAPPPAPPPTPPPPARGPSGWPALRSALGVRPTTARVVGAILLGLLAFAVVVQVRTTRAAELDTLRQSDLVRILDDTTERAARLRTEIAELEATRRELTSGSDGSAAAIEEARERTEALGVLAGSVAATGPGILVSVPAADPALVADLLLDAVQELRDAGAEAMQVDDVRIIASTWFSTGGADGGRVIVDGEELEAPYELLVIGDPQTLSSALDIPGGVIETYDAQIRVQERDSVLVEALRSAQAPAYARPAVDR
jgi:uncharacterized protein YlxW (UPF0749 family)